MSSSGSEPLSKPRLVFFQHRNDEKMPDFLLAHRRAHVDCLAHFFEVTVHNSDGDFGEICDRLRPDLTLFECGLNQLSCRKPRITNLQSRPEVPKAALHNADAWCDARAGLLADVEEMGIETFFAISVTSFEHTPELGDGLYVWPNCIDARMFRLYGEAKNVPLLFTGAMTALYPWRTKIQRILTAKYPSLICPHMGYDPGHTPGQMLTGERYARIINASQVVPTCGTVAREVVRKHFEIPAAGSCLVTERTPALEAAGFVDMQNCVFAEPDEVLEKVHHLFRHPEVLARITAAGHELVHARHTQANRDQILQWYRLQAARKPGERIVQRGPFGPFALVPAESPERTLHIGGGGAHLALMAEGDNFVARRQLPAAETAYLKCLNHVQWMPEPKLRLARLRLFQGDVAAARETVSSLNHYVLHRYRAPRPDPVEWSFLIIVALADGRVNDAVAHAADFPGLRHPLCDRARWLAAAAARLVSGSLAEDPAAPRSRTIHRFPPQTFEAWMRDISDIFLAAGRKDILDAVEEQRRRSAIEFPVLQKALADASAATPIAGRTGESFPSERNSGPADGGRKRAAAKKAAGLLHGLEKRFGYFLPYRFSSMRDDELFAAIRLLAEKEDFSRALLVGASAGNGVTEAFLAGCWRSRFHPAVHCSGCSEQALARLRKRTPGHRLEDWPLSGSGESVLEFGAIVIDPSAWLHEREVTPALVSAIRKARFIVVDDINSGLGFQVRRQVTGDAGVAIAAENPELRGGYAIYHRTENATRG
ncbi:MAG TPA: glycosyltransferase [Candidatus Didemnitutus sp.]|nr:glycosyltransferase [Candidatus Didemnitutus sp.]